jgi:hypothetical protein
MNGMFLNCDLAVLGVINTQQHDGEQKREVSRHPAERALGIERKILVDERGFEPPASSLRTRRSPS